jgi:hypothetical protein
MKRKVRICPNKCGGSLNLIGECPLCELFASGQAPGGHLPSNWPLRSKALAVHKTQVVEANERNRRHGIAARYEADGTCVIPDRGDRARLLRLEKAHDNSGGYGD